MGPQPIFCYVPFNSMTFSFQGKVFTCSYNRDAVLGYYPDKTIDEIWNGVPAQKIREHMSHNDLDFGCQHCKYFFEKRKFSNLKPLVWDKYAEKGTDNPMPRVLEFELSNECNLECQMCLGEVSSSIRKNRDKLSPIKMPYDDAFIEQLEKYIPHLEEAKFYGGEPFLIDIYYKIWAKITEINPNIKIFVITNGTAWNKKIRTVLENGHFDVAISIDSTHRETLEKIRKNIRYDTLMSNIDNFSSYCLSRGANLSLSFTAQRENWQDFPDYVSFCNEKKAYMYVSYLETPVQFAIPGLPVEELKKIRDFLEGFEYSGTTLWEQHNAQCFMDFRNFIGTYIKNNEEKRYVTYKLTDNVMMDPNKTTNDDGEELDYYHSNAYQPIVFNLKGNEEQAFNESLNHYFDNTTDNISMTKEEVQNKLKAVMADFEENERKRVYYVLLETPMPEIIRDMKILSVDGLNLKAKAAIRAI